MIPQQGSILGTHLLGVAIAMFIRATFSNGVSLNAVGNPVASASFGGDSVSGERTNSTNGSSGGRIALSAGGSLSSPISGHISFRAKTSNGVRGLLPKPPRLSIWGPKQQDEGLDTTKRFLYITEDMLVLEVEGEDECLSIARGPESLAGARVTVMARNETGIEMAAAAAAGSSSASKVLAKIEVDGLFGVYNLLSGPFIAVITKSKLRYVNRDLGLEFRQVSKVRLVPVLAAPRVLDDGQAREEARLLALLALAFRSHQLYFSHVHDVTRTLQSLRTASLSAAAPASAGTRATTGSASAEAKAKGKAKGAPSSIPSSGAKKKKSKASTVLIGEKQKRLSKRSSEGISRLRGPQRSPADEAVLSPPDTRFHWNLAVLGPLLELRDELESGSGIGNSAAPHPSATGATVTAGASGVRPEAAVAAVDRWLTPVMSGFMQVERGCLAGDKGFDIMFVSRRSRLRQGTRYTRRGIDNEGNVANFVETEQSLLHEDRSVTSHVQIRGSIPVFWSSPTNLRYHPKVRIDPDEEASLRALRLHSGDVIRRYGQNGGGVVFVNLVDKKNEQGALGEAFGAALDAVEDRAGVGAKNVAAEEKENAVGGISTRGGDLGGAEAALGSHSETVGIPEGSLRHVWFDFHHECRNMHWENLDKLLAIVDREFVEQGFYHAGPGGEILSLQDGVIRTNCMDCLDRTNVVQSLLARRSMLLQLCAAGVDIPEVKGRESAALALTLDMLEMPAEELERRFRDVWGNNADEISMLYAGTPALKGDFTRTGQRTKMGLLQDGTNSAIRYVVNNFQDHRRQEAVDVLLGINRPVVDADGNILDEFIKEPLDLDLWATRLSQPQAQRQILEKHDSGRKRQRRTSGQQNFAGSMGNKESTHSSTFSRGQGATSDIRDALSSLPGGAPTNKSGRKVTAQKMKTAAATGVLALQEHGLKEVPDGLFLLLKLRTLNMSSNSIKLLPPAINSLVKLKTLRLDANKLEVLPDLSSLSCLTDISAGGNRLTGSEALAGLPACLTKLVLRNNKLGEVPRAVVAGLPALQVLDLSANAIEGLPPLAVALPALAELILDENSLRALGDELVGLSKLRKLSARSNCIAAVDPFSGEQAISRGLFADSTIEFLELAGNILDKPDLLRMEGVDAFLARREKIKNKSLQGGGMLTLSVCGLD